MSWLSERDAEVLAIQREVEGRWPQCAWEIEVTKREDQLWLIVKARPVGSWTLDANPPPAELEYAIWRSTGAIHRVIDGEVQDPELVLD